MISLLERIKLVTCKYNYASRAYWADSTFGADGTNKDRILQSKSII